MITFQTLDGYEIDLTSYGLTFNEESDYFNQGISKNYTFPISIDLDDDVADKLGLVNIDNIADHKIKIPGYLIVENDFFDAYIAINEVLKNKVELKFFYGKETLSLFDKKLSQLPWPIIDTGGSLLNFAKVQLQKSYPEATHNFPKIYRPEIRGDTNYEKFQLFVNNYTGFSYPSNSLVTENGEQVTYNRNVMAPAPYLLEILRLGFSTEGLELRGKFANDALMQKLVIIPKTFFEFYVDPLQRRFWQFEFPDAQETVGNKTINVYEFTVTPASEGTYLINYKLDFPKGIAQDFNLKITYGSSVLFSVNVQDQALNLDDELVLNLVDTSTFEEVKVSLRISEQTNTIAALNSFSFNLKGGTVNEYPQEYSLSSFVPNMNFRTLFNIVKTWLNLEVTYYENSVYINYLDDVIQNLIFEDHSGLEVEGKRRRLDSNNLFRLSYPNGKQVLVAKTGQVYNDTDFTDNEIEKIPFEVQPITVSENESVVTGVFPEDSDAKLLVGIYDGLVNDQPILRDALNGNGISLQNIYDRFHKVFLSFRANAELFKDTFEASIHQSFDLKKGIFKYNKKHLIKKIRKRLVNDETWKVDQESESF
ncbi:MAG: hypothetical protein WBG90_18510 [Saonia sp.]